MKRFLALIALAALAVGCSGERSAKPAVTPVKSDDPVAQRGIDQCAALWRAEDGTQAAYRYMHAEEDVIRSTYAEKGSLALSVRCVR